MILTRRGFLKGMLAAGVAPAIVRADSLMKIISRDMSFLTATAVEPLPPILPIGAPLSVNPMLWPGVNRYWGMDYSNGKDKSVLALFELDPKTDVISIVNMYEGC